LENFARASRDRGVREGGVKKFASADTPKAGANASHTNHLISQAVHITLERSE
jgi:hypothetical protein